VAAGASAAGASVATAGAPQALKTSAMVSKNQTIFFIFFSLDSVYYFSFDGTNILFRNSN
jgi:hypothetical protein